MLKITSTANDRVKFLKTLKTKKGREESGTYLLEGRRAVCDAIDNGVEFVCLLVEEGFPVDVLPACEIIEVSRHVIEALSETQSPEGLIAQVRKKNTAFSPDGLNGLVIFLDHLQDAGNLGTIIRTADAAGCSAVILSEECVELFNPKTVRATMSSLFNVPVMITDNSLNALDALKNAGYTLFAAALGGQNVYERADFPQKSCVIIGNEGNGITAPVMAKADKKLMLPMRGKAESLNAGVAAGIFIYHFTFGK